MKTSFIAALVAAVTLAACGGGGASPGVVAAVETAPVTPVVTLPVPTVADVLVELNRLRTGAGFPAANVDSSIQRAAENHAAYLAAGGASGSLHVELASKVGFTGVTVADRIASAGYLGATSSSEVVCPANPALPLAPDPVRCLRTLITAPYHGLELFSDHRDVGAGWQLGAGSYWLVVDMASKAGTYSSVSVDDVRVWPCNGLTNVPNKTFVNEVPAPVAGRNLELSPIGTPIYVMGTEGRAVALASFEVKHVATGTVATIVKVLGNAVSDGLPAWQRAILPDKPLAELSEYVATVSGLTASGKAFNKSCRFTTGPDGK